MSSSRKTINELAAMFQDHVNWLGRYGSVPRRMALRIVNVQAGEVLDRIPRLLALERVVRGISWQWMHEAWDVVTGMTCESPRECAGTRKPIPSGALQGWEASLVMWENALFGPEMPQTASAAGQQKYARAHRQDRVTFGRPKKLPSFGETAYLSCSHWATAPRTLVAPTG